MLANLVQETSTTTGTGDLTLAGAAETRWRTFNAAFGTGSTNKFRYVIHHRTALEYEIGIGYLSASTTLVRETILESSNANAAVSFSSGTKDVSCSVGVPYGLITAGAAFSTVVAPGYYHRPPYGNVTSTVQPANGEMSLHPIDFPAGQKLDRIGAETTTGGGTGSVTRFGIYRADPATGLPGALVLDAGTVASTGVAIIEVTIALTIVRGGRHFLAAVTQGAPSPNPIYRGATTLTAIGQASAPANTVMSGYTQGSVTGALPDPSSGINTRVGTTPALHVRGA